MRLARAVLGWLNPLDWSDRRLIVVRAILTFALAFLAAPLVHAGSITSTWSAPILYSTDGSKITEPISYRLEYGPSEDALTQSVSATTTKATVPNLAPGRWCNRVIAIVANIESDPGPTVCVTVPALQRKPNPAYGLATTAAP